jgi:hypothetical protein
MWSAPATDFRRTSGQIHQVRLKFDEEDGALVAKVCEVGDFLTETISEVNLF